MLRLLAIVLAIAALAFWYVFFGLGPAEPAKPDPVEAVTPEAAPVADLEAMECRLDVDRWDAGKRAEVEHKYGENAEAVVEGCRALVAPPAD